MGRKVVGWGSGVWGGEGGLGEGLKRGGEGVMSIGRRLLGGWVRVWEGKENVRMGVRLYQGE